MSKKIVFIIIGLACLAVGIYGIVPGMGVKIAAYALLAIGALLVLGPIVGIRKLISLFVFLAVSTIAYYLIVSLLGTLGVVLQAKGKTAIAIVTFLSVYILSSSFTKGR